jgi:hypothetical protein
MPGKRSTTPLFDLLQQRRPRGVEVRLPEPENHRPRPTAHVPDTGGSRSLAARFADAPIRIVGGVVQMPLVYAAVALTVAFAGVVGSWTIGFRSGEAKAKAEQDILESAMGPASRITEPGDPGAEEGSDPRTTRGDREETPPSTPDSGPPPFLSADGAMASDPRSARHNYLYLAAQLEAASVLSGIEHLRTRGIDAFAEIDPATIRRKNGPLYSLIAARGIPSGETGSEAARLYRDQVIAAGTAWKQEGGKWDFADAYWKLYTPKGDS